MNSPFEIRGPLVVKRSALTIPMRQRNGEWEVLLTESEVINWLKSTRDKLVPMRYGGEWRPPGGNVDDDEDIEDAAKRELQEEVLSSCNTPIVDSEIKLKPFTVRQSYPIRSKSNIIYVYLALEDDNPWIRSLDTTEVNQNLLKRRSLFMKLALSEKYWSMPMKKRELISPEVHSINWVTISTAITKCWDTMKPGTWSGSFQESEHQLWRLKRIRDPMRLTGLIFQAVAVHETAEALNDFLSKQPPLNEIAKKVQFLYDGMSAEDTLKRLDGVSFYTKKSKL